MAKGCQKNTTSNNRTNKLYEKGGSVKIYKVKIEYEASVKVNDDEGKDEVQKKIDEGKVSFATYGDYDINEE